MKKIIPVLVIFLSLPIFAISSETELKITSINESNANEVEIYMTPESRCCVAALEDLKKICSENKANISVKPVGTNCNDRAAATKWICSYLFNKQTKETLSISEKAVSKNEDELRMMKHENYPIIIFKNKALQTSQKFEGWDSQVYESLILSMKEEPSYLIP
jgi:hypothetical protein